MNKFLITILSALLLGSIQNIAMADTVDVGHVHLDATTGFTSNHGTYKQFDGIFNYGGNLTLGLSKHLEAFGTVGQDSAYQVVSHARTALPTVLSTSDYSVFVYSGGLKWVLSPAVKFQIEYDQALDPTFIVMPNVLHEVNVQGTVRLF